MTETSTLERSATESSEQASDDCAVTEGVDSRVADLDKDKVSI